MKERVDFTPPDNFDVAFTFKNCQCDNLIQVSHDGKVRFNREMFPHVTADEFAKAFIAIVNECCTGSGTIKGLVQ